MYNKLKLLKDILQKTIKNNTKTDLEKLTKHSNENFDEIINKSKHQTHSEQVINSEKNKKNDFL